MSFPVTEHIAKSARHTTLCANESETFPLGEITVEGGESNQGNGCRYEWESCHRGRSRG